MDLNELSKKIIGAAIEVHRHLGPGLLEKTYQKALLHELSLVGLDAEEKVRLPVRYKNKLIPDAYEADIVVEDEIILELKSVEKDNPIYSMQLNTYLRLADKKLGLLINFNKSRLTDGIQRVINNNGEEL